MQFEDIHLSDAQLYTLFRQYYTQGAYAEALNVLASNPQLDLKAVTADNLNELSERVYGLENVYYTEVEDYLSNLLQSMQTQVNNLSNQNQYSATQQYYPNNFVYYNDEVYFCVQEPPVGTLPTNTTYWLYLGLLGITGKGGISGLTFTGEWNSGTTYKANDVTYVGTTFYYALQGSTGQQPTGGETDVYWGILFSVTPQQVVVNATQPTLNTNDIWFQVTN